MSKRWVLVNPVAQRNEMGSGVEGAASLSGRRFGFFTNNKQNCREVHQALAESWSAEFGVQPIFYRKLNASAPADPALIDQIVAECDAVITGSGDCGSCTAATAHDSITLRARGLPVAMLATDTFAGLARMQARSLGDEGLDLILVTHPLGGIIAADLGLRCAEAIANARPWLTHLFAQPAAV